MPDDIKPFASWLANCWLAGVPVTARLWADFAGVSVRDVVDGHWLQQAADFTDLWRLSGVPAASGRETWAIKPMEY